MSILWTILIGFVAGVIAKLVTPGSNEPQGSSSLRSWASWARSSLLISGKLLVGTERMKARVSLEPRWVR
mgnify:CR=1 FL=1